MNSEDYSVQRRGRVPACVACSILTSVGGVLEVGLCAPAQQTLRSISFKVVEMVILQMFLKHTQIISLPSEQEIMHDIWMLVVIRTRSWKANRSGGALM
jgi:hypothetical protein